MCSPGCCFLGKADEWLLSTLGHQGKADGRPQRVSTKAQQLTEVKHSCICFHRRFANHGVAILELQMLGLGEVQRSKEKQMTGEAHLVTAQLLCEAEHLC